MSKTHKKYPRIVQYFGTILILFFYYFSTIMMIVNRNPSSVLFTTLIYINYLYSPHDEPSVPPDGSYVII